MQFRGLISLLVIAALASGVLWYLYVRDGTSGTTTDLNLSPINTQAGTSHSPATTCEPTPTLAQGPYYKTGSPERQEIRTTETAGFTITLHGQVLDTNCQPISGAILDFWQADGNGAYDTSGFRLRGHQVANANGEYTLYTVIPGQYPGRTEHIHVRVRRPDGEFITTQLFFPLSEKNATEEIFDERLVVEHFADENLATFDFVLE